MDIEIVQMRDSQSGRKKNSDTIEISIRILAGAAFGVLHAFLHVYFGGKVNRAEYYALGQSKGIPVLVPLKKEGGYKVRKISQSNAGYLQFKLTNEGLNAFGKDVVDSIRYDIEAYAKYCRLSKEERLSNPCPEIEDEYIFSGQIDDKQQVWIKDRM